MQGHDGVDLEMNLNDNKSRLEDDEFGDMVCCFPFCSVVSSKWICLDEKLISCRTVELPFGYMTFCGPVLKTLQDLD